MERGLLWLPLLLVFIGLAWAGWNEYQKIEAYQAWAKDFDKAKYDIYAVLGQKNLSLTWGKPARNRPIDLQTFSLANVSDVRLLVDGQAVDASDASKAKNVGIEFTFVSDTPTVMIPFTDVSLASQWVEYLENLRLKEN